MNSADPTKTSLTTNSENGQLGPESGTQFLAFEAQMLATRYEVLKDTDVQTWKKQLQMLGFQATYAAAPYLFEREFNSFAVVIWGLGGLWLTVAVLFTANRDFRAYGRHLKERVYCLHQIAAIRKLCMGSNTEYSELTIQPMGSLAPMKNIKSTNKADELPLAKRGFIEFLDPKAIKTASHFFKIICLFPMFYFYFFLTAFMQLVLTALFQAPSESTGRPALLPVLWISIAGSGFMFYWLERCRTSCLGMQLTAFEARRISPAFPWPLMNWDRVDAEEQKLLSKKFFRSSNSKKKVFLLLGLLNFALGLILLMRQYDPMVDGFVDRLFISATISAGTASLYFVYLYRAMDDDLTSLMSTLRKCWESEYGSRLPPIAEPVLVHRDQTPPLAES